MKVVFGKFPVLYLVASHSILAEISDFVYAFCFL